MAGKNALTNAKLKSRLKSWHSNSKSISTALSDIRDELEKDYVV